MSLFRQGVVPFEARILSGTGLVSDQRGQNVPSPGGTKCALIGGKGFFRSRAQPAMSALPDA